MEQEVEKYGESAFPGKGSALFSEHFEKGILD